MLECTDLPLTNHSIKTGRGNRVATSVCLWTFQPEGKFLAVRSLSVSLLCPILCMGRVWCVKTAMLLPWFMLGGTTTSSHLFRTLSCRPVVYQTTPPAHSRTGTPSTVSPHPAPSSQRLSLITTSKSSCLVPSFQHAHHPLALPLTKPHPLHLQANLVTARAAPR